MNHPQDFDISTWLDGLGLGQYAAAFVENDITRESLAHLAAEDLKELGVAALGHRKILLHAIAQLQSTPPAVPKPVPVSAPAPRLPAEPVPEPRPPREPSPVPEPVSKEPSSSSNIPPRTEDSGPEHAPRNPAPRSTVTTPSAPSRSPTSPATAAPSLLKKRGFWAGLLASKFLLISIGAHLFFGVGATYFIVQQIQAKRKLTFQGGPSSPNASKRALEHKVSMAQKKKTGGAPPQAKRIVSAGLAKVSLPEMPSLPSASNVVPGMTAGMGGAGFGTGMGFGAGSGSGMGGAGTGTGTGFSFFGFRGGGGGLVGTFYDLKQKKNHQPTGVNGRNYTGIVRKWVDENLRESIIDDYFKAPQKLSASQFMIPDMDADEAPKAYGVEKEVKPAQWVAHYQGKVSPPKSGTYYFVGAADDVLIVRFAGKLVLDGSWEQTSSLKAKTIFHNGYGGHPDQGFSKGEAIHVEEGQWYDIDVVIGERPGGHFWTCLCIAEQGVEYKKDGKGVPLFPLFRFSSAKPPGAKSKLPPFDENGPIWKAQGSSGPVSALDAFKKP